MKLILSRVYVTSLVDIVIIAWGTSHEASYLDWVGLYDINCSMGGWVNYQTVGIIQVDINQSLSMHDQYALPSPLPYLFYLYIGVRGMIQHIHDILPV